MLQVEVLYWSFLYWDMSFIKSLLWVFRWRGCPIYVNTNRSSNFVATEVRELVSSLGVEWNIDLPLAPWHGGFLKYWLSHYWRKSFFSLDWLIKSCKPFFKAEGTLNNRPLTYYYADNENDKACMTPRMRRMRSHNETPRTNSLMKRPINRLYPI